MKEKHLQELRKEFFVLMVFLVFETLFAFMYKAQTRLYPETAIVTDINKEGEKYIIEFTTSNGNMFEYETEDGDCFEGDFYSILFSNNGTETVKDDRILKIKYCGF